MELISIYKKIRLSGRTLNQAGLLSTVTAVYGCRKDIGLTKLSSDNTLYRRVAERQDILPLDKVDLILPEKYSSLIDCL
jgi:hypothetical protein